MRIVARICSYTVHATENKDREYVTKPLTGIRHLLQLKICNIYSFWHKYLNLFTQSDKVSLSIISIGMKKNTDKAWVELIKNAENEHNLVTERFSTQKSKNSHSKVSLF